MNEITEYRKATAEALGFKIAGYGYLSPGCYEHRAYYKGGSQICDVGDWHPDTDHDQMAMVKKLLFDQGYRILMDLYSTEKKVFIYPHGIKGSSYDCYEFSDKSELTAFRKAFMKYYKTKQDGRD